MRRFAVGASQQHTRVLSFLFLEFNCLFQRNIQHTGTVGGRPRRDIFDFVSDESNNSRVIGLRNEKVPLYIHEFLLAGRMRELFAADLTS